MNMDTLNNLGQHTGTEHYHRNPIHGRLLYTDGVKALLDGGECHWLMDVIASYQPSLATDKDERLYFMQFWCLTVAKDKTAVVTCRADSDVEPAVTQSIPWTDFPLDKVDVWVCRDEQGMVAILPSEY